MDIFFLNDVAEDFFSKHKFSLNNFRSEVSGAGLIWRISVTWKMGEMGTKFRIAIRR